jgi:glutamate-5-semialdehyde dehydrogenase
MIYKYVLVGSGQVVKDYVGKNAKQFKHIRKDEECPLR